MAVARVKDALLLPVTAARNAIPLGGAFLMAPSFLVIATVNKSVSTPFSPRLAAAVDRLLYSGYMSYVALFYELISHTDVVFHVDNSPAPSEDLLAQDGAVLYISNHQCTMDWVVASWVASRQSVDCLSRMQFVMKSAVSLLPCYGFYLYMHGGAFVRKNRERDAAELKAGVDWFWEVGARPWIVLYPEGTRIQPQDSEKMRESQEHCQRHQFPPFQYVLAPRVRGFRSLASELLACYGDAASVCDVTIAYRSPGETERRVSPSMISFMGGGYARVEVRVKRIPIVDIPLGSEEETRNWLYELYEEKDQWLAQAYTGSFDTGHLAIEQTPKETNNTDHRPISEAAPSGNMKAAVHDDNSQEQVGAQGIGRTRRVRSPRRELILRATITMAVCLSPYLVLSRRRAAGFAAMVSVGSVVASRLFCYR